MIRRTALLVFLGCAATAMAAQGSRQADSQPGPSSAFPRGNSQQAWQNPGLKAVLAKCKTPPAPFAIPVQPASPATTAAPPDPVMPTSTAIPGVIAAGQTWKTVWAWEGNNADGIIAGDKGTVLFANNDASNVMQLDPATGLATILHRDMNTGGAVSRSKNGALFMVSRGLHPAVVQLEPQRKVLANSFRGEPLDCVGGVRERPRRPTPAAASISRSPRRRLLRQPAGRGLAVRRRRRRRQRHHPQPRRKDPVRHQRTIDLRVRREGRTAR